MIDPTPTFDAKDIFPDSADPVDEALAQLREPHHLLAEALLLTRAAQATGQEIDTTPAERDEDGDLDDEEFRREARHRRRLDEAASLTRIAKVAAELAAGRVVFPSTFDDADLEDRTVPPNDLTRAYEPQPVNGVRFTADIVGHYVGRVADKEWLHVIGHGFINIGDADEHNDRPGGRARYILTGRLVSATPDHALCVTDGGTSVTLPRALIVESADE